MRVILPIINGLLLLALGTPGTLAQEELQKPKSAYQEFLSDRGTMITRDFFDLPQLSSSYKKLTVKVIRLTAAKGEQYFLSISAKGEYSDKSAVISHDDLLEVNKALETIMTNAGEEATQSMPYRERFFVTNDGFKLGYYQKGTEQTVFIDLDDYQSDDSYFFDSFGPLQDAITQGIERIRGLKS